MKKFLIAAMTICMCLVFFGCGNNDGSSTNSTNEKYYFKDNVAVLEDVKIEITDYKVIPVGENGNEYGEKPVIAFWYEVTNTSDGSIDIDPIDAWLAVFPAAIQDNDPDAVNELEIASLPDERFIDSQTEKIKVGGTVENAWAYYLDDGTTPVKLTAVKGSDKTELGTMTYDIK